MLRLGHQQIVEAIDLGPRVRQGTAALHHRVKAVVMLDLERDKERDDRVPRVRSPRPQQVAAHFAFEHVAACLAVHQVMTLDRFVVARCCWFECAGVEHPQVTREPGDHQLGVEGGEGTGGHRISGVDEHLEPLAEAIDVELFVAPGPRVAPQIEIEQRGELRGCGRGHELAARLQPAARDESMQGLRREVRDDPREDGRVEQTRQAMVHRAPIAGRRVAVRCGRHGPAIIPAAPANKQS